LRFIQSFLAIIATLLLIVTSEDVVDIILNFAAVNFISALDEVAFELAKYGKYGPQLEKAANDIEKRPIPYSIYRKDSNFRYMLTVVPIFITMISLIAWMTCWQESKNIWTTLVMRVEFQDSKNLKPFNGCYMFDSETSHRRMTYNQHPNKTKGGVFGYCKKERYWVLFYDDENDRDEGGPGIDPCDATKLAHSSKTDLFDISSSFDDLWYTSGGNFLDARFFHSDGNGTELTENCNSFLDDGICDDNFNNPDDNYDSGDCCASTCDHQNCGVGGIKTAFNTSGLRGNGYPRCKDPKMVPLTIVLHDVVSNRHVRNDVTKYQAVGYYDEWSKDYFHEDPIGAYFVVDCGGVNILAVDVDNSTKGQFETIMVEDGARCVINVSNRTSEVNLWDDRPIWLVNYTVYHGNDTTNEIVSTYSGHEDTIKFSRIPDCYFHELNTSITVSTAYTVDSDAARALKWLINDDSGSSGCEGDFLAERFALSAINLAAPINGDNTSNDSTTTVLEPMEISNKSSEALWISTREQCRWPQILCNKTGSAEALYVRKVKLLGSISTTVGLLTGLKDLYYDANGLTGTIPTEIGQLTDLRRLDIDDNNLTGTIPTEFGRLIHLEELDLENNALTGTIPTELGMIAGALDLDFYNNKLSGSIPSELCNTRNMTTIIFGMIMKLSSE